MKYILALYLVFSPFIVFAATPDNELPLYEGVKKTTQQIEADKKFVSEAITAAGSKSAALDQLIVKGWDAIQSKDYSTAMRRFNQGYLISADDYRVYWGLGTVSAILGKNEKADELFAKGLTYNRKDVRFLCDCGFSLQQTAISNAQKNNIDPRAKLLEAKKLFEQAVLIDPKASFPHARLAVVNFIQGDCPATEREVKASQVLGGEGLDPRFLNDYKIRCAGK